MLVNVEPVYNAHNAKHYQEYPLTESTPERATRSCCFHPGRVARGRGGRIARALTPRDIKVHLAALCPNCGPNSSPETPPVCFYPLARNMLNTISNLVAIKALLTQLGAKVFWEWGGEGRKRVAIFEEGISCQGGGYQRHIATIRRHRVSIYCDLIRVAFHPRWRNRPPPRHLATTPPRIVLMEMNDSVSIPYFYPTQFSQDRRPLHVEKMHRKCPALPSKKQKDDDLLINTAGRSQGTLTGGKQTSPSSLSPISAQSPISRLLHVFDRPNGENLLQSSCPTPCSTLLLGDWKSEDIAFAVNGQYLTEDRYLSVSNDELDHRWPKRIQENPSTLRTHITYIWNYYTFNGDSCFLHRQCSNY
ncbi:hypothetical protein J6590_029625 [Homalodisca vitripennis]|nr:hypothetical protein J6590_029625 [Homalodisca vitripennis]